MAEYSIKGYVKSIGEKQTYYKHLYYDSTWRTFILEDIASGIRKTTYEFSCFGAVAEELHEHIHPGDKIEVFFTIVPKEYNGKFYYTLRATRFQKVLKVVEADGKRQVIETYDQRQIDHERV